MPTKNVSLTITVGAYDTGASAYKTGDAANITLRGIGDGTVFTPSGSITEADSTHAPGAYNITLTASEMNHNAVWVGGKSSTSGVNVIPFNCTTDAGLIGSPLNTTLAGDNAAIATAVATANSGITTIVADVTGINTNLAPYAQLVATGTISSVSNNGAFSIVFTSAYDGNTASLTDGTFWLTMTRGLNHYKSSKITGGTLADSTHATLTFTSPFPQTVTTSDTWALISN